MHLWHKNMVQYCGRPENFTEQIAANWDSLVRPEDTVIDFGDVTMHASGERIKAWLDARPGKKIHIRGNHDRNKSCVWWQEHGYDFSCDGIKVRQWWITHEPSTSLADGCKFNLCGHLHNYWHNTDERVINVLTGKPFDPHTTMPKEWQRLLALEYVGYGPIECDKFVNYPDRWQAKGPK